MTIQDGFLNEIGAEQADAEPERYFNFKNVGDFLVGKLMAFPVEASGTYGPETHAIFGTRDETGKAVAVTVNCNADLRKRLSVAKIGTVYRTAVSALKDIGKPSPMKVYAVQPHDGKSAIAAWSGRAPDPLAGAAGATATSKTATPNLDDIPF